jgi:hypothetical protein
MPNSTVKWCSSTQDVTSGALTHTIGHSNSSYDGRDCLLLRIFKDPDKFSKRDFGYTWKYEMKNCSVRAIYACQVHIN